MHARFFNIIINILPICHFVFLQSHNQDIGECFVVQESLGTDFEAQNCEMVGQAFGAADLKLTWRGQLKLNLFMPI